MRKIFGCITALGAWLSMSAIESWASDQSLDRPFVLVISEDTAPKNTVVRQPVQASPFEVTLKPGQYHWTAEAASGQKVVGNFRLETGDSVYLSISWNHQAGSYYRVIVRDVSARAHLGAKVNPRIEDLPVEVEPTRTYNLVEGQGDRIENVNPTVEDTPLSKRQDLYFYTGGFDLYRESTAALGTRIMGAATNLGFRLGLSYKTPDVLWDLEYKDRTMAVQNAPRARRDYGLVVPRYSLALNYERKLAGFIEGADAKTFAVFAQLAMEKLPYLGIDDIDHHIGAFKVRSASSYTIGLGLVHRWQLSEQNKLASHLLLGRDLRGRGSLIKADASLIHKVEEYDYQIGLNFEEAKYDECTLIKFCTSTDYRLQEFSAFLGLSKGF